MTTENTTTVIKAIEPVQTTILVLTPVRPDLRNAQQVEVTKVQRFVTKGGETRTSSGFTLSDGTIQGVFGAKIKSAVNAFLKAQKTGTSEDYTFDTESEFFQTAKATKNAANDDPFAGEFAEELRELREAVQTEADEAFEDEAGAQGHWLKVSQAVSLAFDRLKTKGAVAKWAAGDDEGGDKAPWLTSLGAAPNALVEAKIMATLTPRQFNHLHANINRGKAIELELRSGSQDWIIGGADAVLEDFDDVNECTALDTDNVKAAIDGCLEAMGVAETDNLADGLIALDGKLAAWEAECAESGITKHTASDSERAVLRKIVAGHAMLAWMTEALDAIDGVVQVANEADESTFKKANEAAMGKLNSASFVRKIMGAVRKAQATASEKARKEGAEEARRNGEAFQGAKKAQVELSARELAARLWASMRDHASYEQVYAELGMMVGAQVIEDKANAQEAA